MKEFKMPNKMLKHLQDRGIHVLCDGQFGSTGKGALAAYLAQVALDSKLPFHAVLSNAGPNSGHTFYFEGQKHVLKQLPTFAVYHYLAGKPIPTYLNAGAIIDPKIFFEELARYPGIPVKVHPNAAVIDDVCRAVERNPESSIAKIASTQSGVGAASARKILRRGDAVVGQRTDIGQEHWYTSMPAGVERAFMEISQGMSLGINRAFYPHTTSRECTVAQGFADAGLSPRWFAHSYLAARTFPIRVGNLNGNSSGDHYPDQIETCWEDLGVDPELTTVTQRERRVFTFSKAQLGEAMIANTPTVLFMNFMNYLTDSGQETFMTKLIEDMPEMMETVDILQGFGPEVKDIRDYDYK